MMELYVSFNKVIFNPKKGSFYYICMLTTCEFHAITNLLLKSFTKQFIKIKPGPCFYLMSLKLLAWAYSSWTVAPIRNYYDKHKYALFLANSIRTYVAYNLSCSYTVKLVKCYIYVPYWLLYIAIVHMFIIYSQHTLSRSHGMLIESSLEYYGSWSTFFM